MKTILNKLLSAFAYTWAVICLFIIFAIFIKSETLVQLAIKLPFMKVDPIYTGGDIARIYSKDDLLIQVHEPVFEAFIGKPEAGFLQVEFKADSTKEDGNLPAMLEESIDYNGDGIDDFSVMINTENGETNFSADPKSRMRMNVSTRVKNYWMIRVGMPNPDCHKLSCAGCTACALGLALNSLNK